jgi:pyruvate dehydrogenase E1 component
VATDVWSATSYTLLRREALDCERWNLLHPDETPQVPYVSQLLAKEKGVFVAASDYMKALPDGISRWVPGGLTVLGTDGYGRSDTREALRDHFEVDERYIVLATLKSLADTGSLDRKVLQKAIADFKINPDKLNPHHA